MKIQTILLMKKSMTKICLAKSVLSLALTSAAIDETLLEPSPHELAHEATLWSSTNEWLVSTSEFSARASAEMGYFSTNLTAYSKTVLRNWCGVVAALPVPDYGQDATSCCTWMKVKAESLWRYAHCLRDVESTNCWYVSASVLHDVREVVGQLPTVDQIKAQMLANSRLNGSFDQAATRCAKLYGQRVWVQCTDMRNAERGLSEAVIRDFIGYGAGQLPESERFGVISNLIAIAGLSENDLKDYKSE